MASAPPVMTAPPRDRIGDFLLREGLVTEEQLRMAVQDAKEHGTRVGFSLIKLQILAEPELTKALARQYRVPAVDLDRVQVDPKIVKLFPPDLALKHHVLPIRRIGRMLTVAMADPTDGGAIDSLKFVTRCDIVPSPWTSVLHDESAYGSSISRTIRNPTNGPSLNHHRLFGICGSVRFQARVCVARGTGSRMVSR